jgi:hypothetical protein
LRLEPDLTKAERRRDRSLYCHADANGMLIFYLNELDYGKRLSLGHGVRHQHSLDKVA